MIGFQCVLRQKPVAVRVSIIVPVLNEAVGLPEFLDKIKGLAAEVIFVDGGSKDRTVALLRDAGRLCLSAAPGRASQMNAGARAATGDVLLFLHADTTLPLGALNEIRRAVGAGAAGGFFDLRLDSDRALLRLVGRLIALRARLTGVGSGDQAIFTTREAFDRLGGYASLPLFEDVDLSRRLRRTGPVARLRPPVVTSARRWERHGAWSTILRMWILRLLYHAGADVETLARHYEAAR